MSTSEEHDPRGTDLAKQIARSARGAPAKPASRTPRSARTDGPALLGDLLGEVIEEQQWNRELNLRHLISRWPTLVGAVNAQHCEPETYTDGILVVRAESSTWATSLRTIAPQLVAILNENLGQGAVQRVQVIGPQAPNWKKGRRSVSGRGPRDTYG